jgi:hypothetical protein
MMRLPVSLSRLRFTPGSHEVVYAREGGHEPVVGSLAKLLGAALQAIAALLAIKVLGKKLP